LGGHGYVGEWGLDQFVRDARIAMIYEGANGIQALDLVGRKLPKDGGRAITAFFAEVNALLAQKENVAALKPFTKGLKLGLDDLQKATLWLMQNAIAKPDHAGAASHDYMHLFGLVALAYMWLRIADAALVHQDDDPTLGAKLIAGQFFMERMMPETAAHLARIATGADTIMAMAAEDF
jgi:hypothetical protein